MAKVVIETSDPAEISALMGALKSATVTTRSGEVAETVERVSETVDAVGALVEAATTDVNGVEFDPMYCASAADPFYGSGKRKGQWKKKRGVTDEIYDAWYVTQGPAESTPEPEEVKAPGATAEAFGAPAVDYPKTGGDFMAWVAERQAAGKITQADVTKAWADVGVDMGQIFSPQSDPAFVADACAKLCAVLDNG